MTRVQILSLTSFALVSILLLWLYNEYITLESIQANREVIETFANDNRILVVVLFFISYILVTAFLLPVATFMSLLAGALFGLYFGVILVLLSSTIGATISMLFSRYFFHKHARNNGYLEKILQGFEKNGLKYLFAIRLIPIFPFFAINLIMGLTNIKTLQYFLVTLVGIIPGVLLYVGLGTKLWNIETVGDILSPTIVAILIILAILPFAGERIMRKIT